MSSVEACGVGGEDREWISSFFGASANVNEHDKYILCMVVHLFLCSVDV